MMVHMAAVQVERYPSVLVNEWLWIRVFFCIFLLPWMQTCGGENEWARKQATSSYWGCCNKNNMQFKFFVLYAYMHGVSFLSSTCERKQKRGNCRNESRISITTCNMREKCEQRMHWLKAQKAENKFQHFTQSKSFSHSQSSWKLLIFVCSLWKFLLSWKKGSFKRITTNNHRYLIKFIWLLKD
jgi:hypothetical protein